MQKKYGYHGLRFVVADVTRDVLSDEKIDKAEEFRRASEEEYQRLFAGLEQERETADGGAAPGKEE